MDHSELAHEPVRLGAVVHVELQSPLESNVHRPALRHQPLVTTYRGELVVFLLPEALACLVVGAELLAREEPPRSIPRVWLVVGRRRLEVLLLVYLVVGADEVDDLLAGGGGEVQRLNDAGGGGGAATFAGAWDGVFFVQQIV